MSFLELPAKEPLCATFKCPICGNNLSVTNGIDSDFVLFPFIEIHKTNRGYLHYYPCQIQARLYTL